MQKYKDSNGLFESFVFSEFKVYAIYFQSSK
jgi:hypothetical protein